MEWRDIKMQDKFLIYILRIVLAACCEVFSDLFTLCFQFFFLISKKLKKRAFKNKKLYKKCCEQRKDFIFYIPDQMKGKCRTNVSNKSHFKAKHVQFNEHTSH